MNENKQIGICIKCGLPFLECECEPEYKGKLSGLKSWYDGKKR